MDGFDDISDLLRGGVYILRYRNRTVFVGKAKSMLPLIAAHRSNARQTLPTWFPVRGIVFDQILIRPCHPDRIDQLYESLSHEAQSQPELAAD